jgi:DNA-binding transcriptional regulator LsrR (DeoR family)
MIAVLHAAQRFRATLVQMYGEISVSLNTQGDRLSYFLAKNTKGHLL